MLIAEYEYVCLLLIRLSACLPLFHLSFVTLILCSVHWRALPHLSSALTSLLQNYDSLNCSARSVIYLAPLTLSSNQDLHPNSAYYLHIPANYHRLSSHLTSCSHHLPSLQQDTANTHYHLISLLVRCPALTMCHCNYHCLSLCSDDNCYTASLSLIPALHRHI